MKCRGCLGENLKFTKHISVISGRDTFHYKVWCLTCGKVYNEERCFEIYQQVKDQPWIRGNKTPKRVLKQFKREIKHVNILSTQKELV